MIVSSLIADSSAFLGLPFAAELDLPVAASNPSPVSR